MEEHYGPDPTDGEDYFSYHRSARDFPERKLFEAIFSSAMISLSRGMKHKHYVDAWNWLKSEHGYSSKAVMSSDIVCEAIGVNIQYLRQKMGTFGTPWRKVKRRLPQGHFAKITPNRGIGDVG